MIEWNGRPLHGRSCQDVADIVFESKQEPQVELIVSRVISTQTPSLSSLSAPQTSRRAAHTAWLQTHPPSNRSHEGTKLYIR